MTATGVAIHEEAALRACLRDALDVSSIELLGHEQLKDGVHRVEADGDGTIRSLILKWSDAAVARRCALVTQRWLRAAGLEDLGPRLVAVVTQPDGERAWHVYEELPGRPLSTAPPVKAEVEAVMNAIARVHTTFADHPMLPECRLWGGDRGRHFYSSNLRDAVVALRSLDPETDRELAAREALLERIGELRRREPERALAYAAGGPDTLLHGDLWPTNTLVREEGHSIGARLIDWDEASVGPALFDVSTLVLRFDPSYRTELIDSYRHAVARLGGPELPRGGELMQILEATAQARLASLLVWSIAAASKGDSGWLPERLEGIVEWLDAVTPVLPAR